MIVIAVIAILAAVVIPTFSAIIKKAQDSVWLQYIANKRKQEMIGSILGDETMFESDSTPEFPMQMLNYESFHNEAGVEIQFLKYDIVDFIGTDKYLDYVSSKSAENISELNGTDRYGFRIWVKVSIPQKVMNEILQKIEPVEISFKIMTSPHLGYADAVKFFTLRTDDDLMEISGAAIPDYWEKKGGKYEAELVIPLDWCHISYMYDLVYAERGYELICASPTPLMMYSEAYSHTYTQSPSDGSIFTYGETSYLAAECAIYITGNYEEGGVNTKSCSLINFDMLFNIDVNGGSMAEVVAQMGEQEASETNVARNAIGTRTLNNVEFAPFEAFKVHNDTKYQTYYDGSYKLFW